MNIQKNASPARKAKTLEAAAAALRDAERGYRVALVDGNLVAAIRAKDLVNSAEIAVELARAAIEGIDE